MRLPETATAVAEARVTRLCGAVRWVLSRRLFRGRWAPLVTAGAFHYETVQQALRALGAAMGYARTRVRAGGGGRRGGRLVPL